MPAAAAASGIRARPVPDCFLCGVPGVYLYQGLRDRLFGAPGAWNLRRCPNTSCRLAWLDPMPIDEDIPKAYRAYYTHPGESGSAPPGLGYRVFSTLRDAYVRRRYGYPTTAAQWWLGPLIWLHPGWTAEADYSALYLPAPTRGMRLLDIGCGDGEALARLRGLGWNDVQGVDLDAVAVRLAQQRGLDVRNGTLASQQYPDASFDVITMSHVIEHVPDPIDLLRECRRVLKPGGKIVIHTPNLQSWGHSIFRWAWLALEPPRHLHLFSPGNLQETLRRSGRWEVTSLQTTLRGVSLIMIASEDIRRDGHAIMARRRNILERVKSHLYHYVRAGRHAVRPLSGEEILLIATVPSP